MAPFAAFGLAVAIATACGGKSVVVSDDSAAGEGATGGHGGSSTGGKGGSGEKGGGGGKGGTGGTGGDAVGGTGGSGGSVPILGGSGGRGGSSARGGGGSAGIGGRSVGGRAGSSGFAGFAGFANSGGVPVAGAGGRAGSAGFAGFAGSGMVCDACNDGDPCTDDVCTPSGMCIYTSNTASCEDGNACTTGDRCELGSCFSGVVVSCDDNEACTIDSCDSALGCSHEPVGVAVDDTDRQIPESTSGCGPPPTSAVSVVSLEDTGNVVWVTAELDLEHTWGGDLTVELAHAGVSVKLLDRFPGDGSLSSNFGGTYTFALTGRMFEKLGPDATIPSDVYASLESLDALKGLPAAGEWTLTVSDGCHDDRGTLWGWRLQVGSSCTGASACSGTCDVGVCECAAP